MMQWSKPSSVVFAFWGLLAIAGCSSSDDNHEVVQWISYSGNTSMAAIDQSASNADDIATGINSSMAYVKDFETLLFALGKVVNGQHVPCGGSYIPQSSENSGAIHNFSNFCIEVGEDTYRFDGHINSFTADGADVVRMRDFSFTKNNMSFSFDATSKETSTTISVDYIGNDGNTYRMQNLDIRISQTDAGFKDVIGGRFFHPIHGYVDIASFDPVTTAADPLFYELCNTRELPTAGTIFIDASDDAAFIQYQSCLDYLMCYQQGTMCNTMLW
ncbi:hypothetical protein [Kaarinaea lacus]